MHCYYHKGCASLRLWTRTKMNVDRVTLSCAVVCCLMVSLPGKEYLIAQAPDSIVADSSKVFPQTFLMEGLTVSSGRRVTTVGGVGVLEISVDSISGLPIPTLEQALRKSPLVRVRRNSRGEAQPNLRGGRDRQVAVLMDGIPLTLGWDHRTDLSVIPLTSAESVRINRGLSSVLQGPNVLAGAIEIEVSSSGNGERLPKPVTLNMGVDHVGSRVIGSSGEQLVNFNAGDLFMKLGVGYRMKPGNSIPNLGDFLVTRSDVLYGDQNLRLNSDSRHLDGFLSANYRAHEGGWVSVVASGSDLARGVAPELHEEDPRLWRYPDQKRGLLILSSGTNQRKTSLGDGEITVSVGLDRGTFLIEQFRTPRYRQLTGKENGRDQTLTFRSTAKHSVGASAEYSAALTYADISHSERILKTPTGYLINRPSIPQVNNYRQRIWSFGNELERTFNSFLGLGGSGPTLASIGLSFDGADTPRSGDKPALARLGDWGGRIGLSSYVPSMSIRLHGGMSRRARFPSLRELYSDALGRFLANPELKAEVLRGSELGFTWSKSSVNLQAVGFYQVLDDAIVRINVDTFAGKKRKRVNKDKIKSSGIEVVAVGDLGRFDYTADLTWQSVWQHGESGVTRPEYEPNVFGRLGLSTELFQQLILETEYRYKGKQFCLHPNMGMQSLKPTNDLGLKLRRLFVIKDSGRLSNLDSSIAISNLGNMLIFDQCGLPQPGRTVELQVRLF